MWVVRPDEDGDGWMKMGTNLDRRDNDAWPHGVSPQPLRVLNMHVDVPTYLGMSPRLRRASWAASKAT